MAWRPSRNVARSSGQHYFPGGQHYIPAHTPGQQWLFIHVTWRALDQSRSRISDSDITKFNVRRWKEESLTGTAWRHDTSIRSTFIIFWRIRTITFLNDKKHRAVSLQQLWEQTQTLPAVHKILQETWQTSIETNIPPAGLDDKCWMPPTSRQHQVYTTVQDAAMIKWNN